LLGRVPGPLSYVIVIGLAIGGWWLTYVIFERFRSRIPYWS
jgi:homopolymeric O-antigen transport system permease protein